MNTRDIGFFLKVCESDSINVAAEQLYITPQGLSNIITKMEKELGEDLFVRSRAGTYLTEFGRAFKPHAEKMMDHYEEALREMQQLRSDKEGSLRLGYAFGALSKLATEIPLQFQEDYQDYRIEYMELPDAVVEEFVEKGEIDIGFTSCLEPEKYESNLMYEGRILFVAHDQSSFYDRDTVSVAEVCREPLTLRDDNFTTSRIVMGEFERYGRKPSLLLRTGGIVRSMILCAEHKANTVILDSLAADFTYENVRAIPFEEDLKWPLYMIRRKDKPLGSAARAFVEHIKQS